MANVSLPTSQGIPAEAMQALFKMSNGNMCIQARHDVDGLWLYCEDCKKRYSINALVAFSRTEEEGFQRILDLCAKHRHEGYLVREKADTHEITKTETGRRIKEI